MLPRQIIPTQIPETWSKEMSRLRKKGGNGTVTAKRSNSSTTLSYKPSRKEAEHATTRSALIHQLKRARGRTAPKSGDRPVNIRRCPISEARRPQAQPPPSSTSLAL
eukprot:gb/GEZJ01008970.1/.p1 GENE.gb/GEZJ01008970.1/~~gb/GEZJ01008970.1/.p1  ORF type:complete len:107 (+),score=6.35 gb/GEZJ01008970.1/:86-406(+)